MPTPDYTRGRHLPPLNPHDERDDANRPVEEQPAVERGERIDAGKTIARGGHDQGRVPGADDQQ